MATKEKAVEIDLLSGAGVYRRWRPHIRRQPYNWKVYSGDWQFELPERILFHRESGMSNSENASVIGASAWDEYDFEVTFKFQSDTVRPPEGGVILLFLFKDIRNHYSFHFCVFKKKIELIKRRHGIWTVMAGCDYNFEKQRDYHVTVSTGSAVHQCKVDETRQIQFVDSDISKGCVGIGAKYCDVEISRVSVSIPSTI